MSILNVDKYKILSAQSANQLEVEIQKMFDKGYKPQGGISVSMDSKYGETWAQAVIKDGNYNKGAPEKYLPPGKL